MVHKCKWAARQDRPQETYTPVSVSVIADNLQAVAGVSLSVSDAEFIRSVTTHLADATIHCDRSRIETCAGLLSAFCMKFTQGVAHE